MGMTILDALDTLWIMGMEDEFDEGRAWLANHFNLTSASVDVRVSETISRVIGGLLSIYEITKDAPFLTMATDVAKR
jgi:mannosyl-oligosaccharide alpha-1,2-mannosidase